MKLSDVYNFCKLHGLDEYGMWVTLADFDADSDEDGNQALLAARDVAILGVCKHVAVLGLPTTHF